MRRRHYQHGWLTRKEQKEEEVWYYSFREYQADGSVVQRKIRVGLVSEFPTEADANNEVELKRLGINREAAAHTPGPLMTFKLLAAHYQQEELSDKEDADPEDSKASSTKDAYESYLKNHIIPKWGSCFLGEIKTVAVEEWLKTLKNKPRKRKREKDDNGNWKPIEFYPAKRMSRGAKAKIKNIMSAIFSHAVRWEFVDRNPICGQGGTPGHRATPKRRPESGSRESGRKSRRSSWWKNSVPSWRI